MIKSISDEHKRKILRNYLEEFYTPLTSEDKILFKERLPLHSSCLIYGAWRLLKKAGCYLLLADRRRINYRFLKTFDQVTLYFDKDNNQSDKIEHYYDETSELFILGHLKTTPEHRYIKDLACYTISARSLASNIPGQLRTVVLSETELPFLHGLLDIVDLRDRISLDSTIEEDVL